MMNCRPPQTVRGPRRIAFAPALRGRAPRFRVRSAAFFARRLRRFFQVIFSKGTYNRKWYIVGRGAALPRAGHLLDPVAPAAASPYPVGAGGLGGSFPSSSMPPAAPFLSAAKEMGERTPPKTNGFWISFARFKCGRKRFHRESATSLPPLPLTRWAVGLDGPTGLGDHQIAHLPPAAASVGAACWAAPPSAEHSF